MAGTHRWTPKSLEERCFEVFTNGESSLCSRTQPIGVAAQAEVDADSVEMEVDPEFGNKFESAVHESLHSIFLEEFRIFGKYLEERLVEELEDAVVRFVNRRKDRVIRWRRAIRRKAKNGR